MYLLFFLALSVLSEQEIYVSRLTGNDTKTCGRVSSPSRNISHGVQRLSTGLYIYLDGTGTSENPYTCEPLASGHPGLYLTKSASFVSMKLNHVLISHVHMATLG